MGLVVIILAYIAWYVLFTELEKNNAFRKQEIYSNQVLLEVEHGAINLFIVFPLVVAGFNIAITYFPEWMPHHLFSEIEYMPFVVQLALAIFLKDCIQYIRHRFMHKFLWHAHVIHHAAKELRSTTHFRMHPVDAVVTNIFDLLILYVLGFGGDTLALATLILAIHNMWLHVNVDIKYPSPFCYLVASPNYHKWHHTSAPELKDKNFADVFPILDWIGGTYYYPQNALPESYGVPGIDEQNQLYHTIYGSLLHPFKQWKYKNTNVTTPPRS